MPLWTGKRPHRLIRVFLAGTILFIAARFYPPTRHPVDSALLLQAVFVGEKGGWLGRWAPPPRLVEKAGGGAPADLYLPAGDSNEVRGCVLLAHGMTDMGRRDHRLVAFARNLARLGFAAAVPELPGMRRFRPSPGDVDRISESFLWMDGKFSRAGLPCGLFAFSFAAGPALKAAARPRPKDRTGYFIGLGAYFDLKTVLKHLTTGGRGGELAFPGGPPVRVGKWLFLRYNLSNLGFGPHAAAIESIVRLKLADERADISRYKNRLPGELRNILALIENRDPARFDEIFGLQSSGLRNLIADWSMGRVIAKTRMPLFLLHGRSDPFVPFRESERLAAAARRRGTGSIRLFVARFLGHVDPGSEGAAGSEGGGWSRFIEALRLAGFVSRMITAMEGDYAG